MTAKKQDAARSTPVTDPDYDTGPPTVVGNSDEDKGSPLSESKNKEAADRVNKAVVVRIKGGADADHPGDVVHEPGGAPKFEQPEAKTDARTTHHKAKKDD
jgi:hypothetical protein